VEDELWVALEGELVIHIMDPSLRQQSQRPDERNVSRWYLRGRVNLSMKDDKSVVSSEADILPCCKLDPPLCYRPA
jgi:hypothetical protein